MARRKVLSETELFELLNDFSDFDDESDNDEIDSGELEEVRMERIDGDKESDDSSTEEMEDMTPGSSNKPAGRAHIARISTASSTMSEENVSENEYFSVRVLRSVATSKVSTPKIEAEREIYDWTNITEKSDIQWRHSRSTDRIADFLFTSPEQFPTAVKSEYEYFQKYLSPKFFEDVSNFTNLYSVQKESNIRPTSPGEIRKLFALHIMMGILKFPRIAMFWEKGTALPIFTDSMPRNRFYELRTHLHLVDSTLPPQNNDKLYRVRPIMDAIRKRLSEHQLEEVLCVDEQIIPFKGRLGIKQYIRGKPCPWGIKLYFLCGKSGMPYDFIAYQGSSTEIDPNILNKLGFGASIVLELLRRVPQESVGHQLYTDNFFTTYSLLELLEKRKILAAGTIRVNRFRNPPLCTDADMRKKGRGYAEQVTSRDGKVIVTKWYDNKGIYLASNFVGIGEKDKVQRYDKKAKQFTEVERPEVVQLYNNGMGGVDLFDQMLQYYRIFIKSKKWTLRVIMHFLDISVVASWMEYRADADKDDIPRNKQMDLLSFKKGLANTLVKICPENPQSLGTVTRRRRISSTSNDDEEPAPKRLNYFQPPPVDSRYDGSDHLPKFDSSQNNAVRCKNEGCKQKTFFYCTKCNAHLCIRRNTDCFYKYHSK